MAFLKVDGAKKVYDRGKLEAVTALSDVQFECEQGEFIVLVGSTGCGKTTILRLIAGLEKPDAGRILLEDRDVDGINRDATLVFQQYSLFPWSNVIDNICFSWEVNGMDRQERYEKGKKLVDLVGLGGFEKSYPYELSGGMQQRAAIARALAYDSKLLLLDEPFGALDERTRHHLQEELFKIWERERKTIILVTHNIDEAIFLGSRIFVMKDSPGSVEEEIAVSLPRPRDRQSKIFVDLHIRIREILENILETQL